MPDGLGGIRETHYPAIRQEDIRYAETQQPFFVPQRVLRLEVPQSDPARATLSVDERDLITHYFARPTPNPDEIAEQPTVSLKVSKDRKKVTANVGYNLFNHHLKGEVRLVKHQAIKLRHSWTIQIGPFAEHTIQLEKQWSSKIITLSIDGEKFVEASAEDIDCERNHWECKFRFVGARRTDFDVYETNKDGTLLDSTGVVNQFENFTRECVVSIGEESDLRTAELIVDGVNFHNLPLKQEIQKEENFSTSADALHMTYGVVVPYKVNEKAPCGIEAYTGTFSGLVSSDGAVSHDSSCFGLGCCTNPKIERDMTFTSGDASLKHDA
jgi:hypothetical protein